MKKPRIHILMTLLLLIMVSYLQAAKPIRLENIAVQDAQLLISYHVDNLLNDESVQAINRGISSQVTHHIQLWKKKSLFSVIEKDVYYSVKIFYDNWGQKYKVVTEDEERLTPHLDKVIQKCSMVQNLLVVEASELDHASEYYISIKIEFEPISAESYNAISDILDGKDTPPDKKSKDKGGMYSIMLNILGFGDKSYTFKSQDFVLTDSGRVQFK